jgi:dienelactone hydrolase
MKTKFVIVAILALIIPQISSAQLKPINYNDGTQKLIGFAAKPKKALKNKPGILVLPAWMGIDDHAKESASELTVLGYYTFVADIYGEGNKPTDYKQAGQKAGYYKKNIQEYQNRIQLALNELVKQGANPDEIVVIGYCFGGTGAIEAARTNMKVKGIVSFHGGLGRDEIRTILPISVRVLVLHGADDPYESETEIKAFQNEMRVAKADWEMVYYANAVHSFTDKGAGTDNSKGAAYNEKADKRSWKAMLQFLKDVL